MSEAEKVIITTVTVSELCRLCQVDRAVIVALVDFGVLSPSGRSETDWRFDQHGIQRAARACRLEHDLGLNTAGVALVLDLLEERDGLLQQMREMSVSDT